MIEHARGEADEHRVDDEITAENQAAAPKHAVAIMDGAKRAMSSGLLAIFTQRIAPRQRGQVMMSTANTRCSSTPTDVEWIEQGGVHTILPRVPKVVAASTVGGELEALLGDGRTRDVATQSLEPLAVAAGHGRAGE